MSSLTASRPACLGTPSTRIRAGKVGGMQQETFAIAKKRQGNLANTAVADSRAMAFTDVEVGTSWVGGCMWRLLF